MLKSFKCLFFVVSMMLSACSIYPLPEDVTSYTSFDISSIVRCQARKALREYIIEAIYTEPGSNIYVSKDGRYKGKTGPELAQILQDHPDDFVTLNWSSFNRNLASLFNGYKDTSISYDFTIDTQETNTNGIDLTLLRTFGRVSDKIGLTAKNDRSRQVNRHFRVFDSFDSLVRLLPSSMCERLPPTNFIYPSTGLIRIQELVLSFFFQNQLGNLGGDGNDYKTAQMTDTITFTTKSTGNIDPSIELNSVAGRFIPSSMSVNVDNSRQDMHTIIILIRLPSDKLGLPQFDEFGRLTLSKKDTERALASNALDQQKQYNVQNALIQLGNSSSRIFP